ncbi:ATP-binding protein [Streptomyces sp. NPDC001262]|uniref:wHTH domain-containing protein n=1 Tax=Streptomyces sp. NPDC001262 TaxID=3364552 RepID=UPI003682CDDA
MENGEARNLLIGGAHSGPVVQAGSVHVHMHQGTVPAASTAGTEDPWVHAAAGSTVWDHVPPTRDVATVRGHVLAVVEALAVVRDTAEAALEADTWHDPEMAVRFAERVGWLLGEPDNTFSPDLYPAEAALLVLVPFLYRANWLRMAARYRTVDPADLRTSAGAGADRLSFEAFADEHDMLVKRALLRPDAAAPIGWWLFHRWLLRRGAHADPDGVRQLIDLLGERAYPLGEALSIPRLINLMHGVRRGPDVDNAEFLERLPQEDRVTGHGHQRVRDRRLVLLLALAYGTCADMTALPDIVVEHIGIPHPVNLDQLRDTLERAKWAGPASFPVLRAGCHHEAVIEGLRDYTTRADEILHRVHRAARERITHPMPHLPTRLSADDVEPAAGVFDGWASFRLDERRVRELLMGVQLYKDRDLAVRELYQNALDACRYRRARTQYLERNDRVAYVHVGRIEFEQGVDADGRAYLECRDNGIGMGDAELRGVFSKAGARFAEQADFKLERAAWSQADPPVEFFPNSRFGIGVLSYFMLADELTVTTCRMGLNGMPGPVLQASVHGPGHLFRIATVADRGEEPGTCVRLYLRDAPEPSKCWSCVDVLERVLGIAEFVTTARHGQRRTEWAAGRLQSRKQPRGERFGLDAHGKRVDWLHAPPGVQVTWTEHGGGLLVDGLIVQPATRNGVLSASEAGLTGVVVNLSGSYAPLQLSADRAEVLDDLSTLLCDLLTQAADDLVGSERELPEFAWICRVAYGSPQLADILTAAAIRAGLLLRYGGRSFDLKRTGILPSDVETVLGGRDRKQLHWDFVGSMPDHIYLWRLVAHDVRRTLDELAVFCPELRDPGPVLPAMPSDQLVLCKKSDDSEYWHWRNLKFTDSDELLAAVEQLGMVTLSAVKRASRLGIHDLGPDGSRSGMEKAVEGHRDGLRQQEMVPTVTRLVLDSIDADVAPIELAATFSELGVEVSGDVVDLAQAAMGDPLLLRDSEEREAGWFGPGETVPPGRIAQASIEFGLTVSEVSARFRAYGLVADHAGLPERIGPDVPLALLREFCGEEESWLTRSHIIPPAHVLSAAAKLSMQPTEVVRVYGMLEFSVPSCFPSDARVDDLELFESELWDEALDFSPPGPLPYAFILDAVRRGRSLGDVIIRFRDYGFDVPMCPPERLDDVDAKLLSASGPCSWWGISTGDVMPFAHLIVAARSVFLSPKELAERMVSYGIQVSCHDFPVGLSADDALELLVADRYEDQYLEKESRLSLQDLLERARQLKVPLVQAVDWLTELGIPVPDVGHVLRQALARVPRPIPPTA